MTRPLNRWPLLLLLLLAPAAPAGAGCKSAYYGTLEKFGMHKRDLLVDRVEEARDDQEEAKEQFKDALTRFSELTSFRGGELEDVYKKLNSEYEASAQKAEDVS